MYRFIGHWMESAASNFAHVFSVSEAKKKLTLTDWSYDIVTLQWAKKANLMWL